MDATVAIVTRDRREVLRKLVDSLAGGTVAPGEVIVLDDDSSDGTAEMLEREFPHVRVVRSDTAQGCVAGRATAAALARGDVIVFLDDDMDPVPSELLERTLGDFDHPRVGAVAIPFMEAWDAPRVRFSAPAPAPAFATFRFAGGSCAVRRDVYESVGGYRPELYLHSEEADFCLRMLAAGFVTRLGTAPPLLHLRLPPDDVDAKAFYGRRNDVLYAWRNVPMPYLVPRLAKVAGRSAMVAASLRQPRAALQGTARGIRDALSDRRQRQPVSRAAYRVAHRLKAAHAVPLPEIESELAALASGQART